MRNGRPRWDEKSSSARGELILPILEESPDDPSATMELGIVELELGNDERGRELIRRAVAAAPLDAQRRFQLGMAESACGDAEAAEAQMLVAITIEPRHGRALQWLSRHYWDAERWPETVWCLERMRENTAPDSVEARQVAQWMQTAQLELRLLGESPRPPEGWPVPEFGGGEQ